MTKTKPQLRAEAAERLRKLNCMDVDCYQLLEATVDDAGEKVGYRVEISKLIDLLTDDEPPEGDAVSELRLWAETDQSHEDTEHVLVERRIMSELADMVERDYVRRDSLTDEEPRKFGVTAEQMAKASADFFDNLPSVNGKNGDFLPTTAEDEDANCKKADSLQDSREKLKAADRVLSMLTGKERVFGDECADERDSREKLVEDSQEKIDADLRGLLLLLVNDVANTAHEQTFDKHLKVDAWWNAFVRITDRQAAITRAECDKPNWDYCETCEQLKAMQDRIDTLEAALKGERNNFYQATEARKHWQREYESVMAERDELKSKADALEADKASWQSGYHIDRIAKLQAQRDRYRDLLSKAVDEAQAIVKLMEVDS